MNDSRKEYRKVQDAGDCTKKDKQHKIMKWCVWLIGVLNRH